MATSLGEAVLELSADDSKLDAKVKEAGKKAESTLKSIGSKMTSVGKTMTAAVTLPILGIGVASIKAASDLEESRSKVQVVFGDQAAAIEEFAASAATNLGMSEEAALAAAGTYGNLFTSMGMGQEAAAGMSTGLVQLAADLASFNNMDPTEVLDKLRAGLTGETEPLKGLGVNLNAASVEAKALEMGLVGVDGELTASAKAQATYALILEQTKNAQGDFARTSDGLANSTRVVKAQLVDAGAKIGTMLLPYALQAVNVIKDLVTWFSNLSPQVMTVILVVAGLAAAIGPLLVVIGTLITSISAIIPVITTVAGAITGPLLLAIGAAIAVVALLALAWKNNWGDIRGKTQAAIDFLKKVISAGLAQIKAWWDQHGDAILSAAKTAWEAIKSAVNAALDFLKNVISTGLSAVKAFWDEHGAAILEAAKTAWDGITMVIDSVLSILNSIFKAFKAAFEGDWYEFGANLRDAWDQTWELMKTILEGAWEAIKDIVKNLVSSVIDMFKNTNWREVGDGIIDGIAKGISSGIQALKDAALEAAQAALDAALGFFGIRSPSTVFMDIGRNLMTSMALGIDQSAMAPVLATEAAAGGMTRAITNNFYLTASYRYQSEATLIDQVKLLSMLGGV